MNRKITQVYLLAGLGFDHRVFSHLNLTDVQINILHWLEPLQNESFDSYVNRMLIQINPNKKPVILIGHSFGGIVIQKLANLLDAKLVIIISSVKSTNELPLKLKLIKQLRLYSIVNKKVILFSFQFWARFFGYNSSESKDLFKSMISRYSDYYFKWAFYQIANFSDFRKLKYLEHIHGTKDKTFPISKIVNPIIVNNGDHFMIFNKGLLISKIINELILKINTA